MPQQNIQPPKHENLWFEGIKTIGLSLFLAFGIRTTIAQSYFIPSGSMEPTLEIDDRLIVDNNQLSLYKPTTRRHCSV